MDGRDIVEKEAEEEEKPVAKEEEAKEQRQGPTAAKEKQQDMMMMSDMILCKNKIGVRRKTHEGIQGDWKFKQLQHKDDHGQDHTTQ